MNTAIIILNWNGFDVLKECLESLMRAKGDFFVVVADNASGDASVEKLGRWCESNSVAYKYVAEGREPGVVAGEREVLVYSLTKNYGFAKGNNIALDIIDTEYICYLNPDTILLEDIIEPSINVLVNNKEIEEINAPNLQDEESKQVLRTLLDSNHSKKLILHN